MNLTLSLPQKTAQQAKLLAASQGKSLSAWFREKVEAESEAEHMAKIRSLDPKTANLVGSALPFSEHWNDPRWRALAEKHLK
ncbi:MAG: hypothetical protein HC904_07690 [Blastochloris sp.]|nr:hypothetical protein [Blastochloris sp.]